MSSVILFALIASTFAAASTKLQLGYPTKLSLKKDTSCVIDFAAGLGAPLARVVVDVSLSILDFKNSVKIYAGRYRNGGPSQTTSGTIQSEGDSDIILTLDRPNLGGLVPEPWWLVIESTKDMDVHVTAVSYDFTHRSRVNSVWRKRSGLIPIEDGAAEIFQMDVPASTDATTVKAVIKGAGWGIIDKYTVYANWISEETIKEYRETLNPLQVIKFIQELANRKLGDTTLVKDLAQQFTPTEANNRFSKTSGWISKTISFDVPASGDKTTLFVAVKVLKNSWNPFDGELSGFSVAFLKGDETEMAANTVTIGTCSPLSKKKRAALETDPCAAVACRTCVEMPECQYCRSSEAGCIAASETCDAGKVDTKETCTACEKAGNDETMCNATPDCVLCEGVSSNALAAGCTDKWTCANAQPAEASGTTVAAAGTTAAGAGTTAAGGTTNGEAAGAEGTTVVGGTNAGDARTLALVALLGAVAARV